MSEIEEDDITPPAPHRDDGPQQVLTPDTARQGPLGPRVLVVLAASMLLVVIVGVALALWVSHSVG